MLNKTKFGLCILFLLVCTAAVSAQLNTCSSPKGQCSGTDSCTVEVEGNRDDKVQWTSSCGGNKETTINGQDENIEFNCATTPPPTPSTNNPPIGNLDIANCEFIRGWALDEDAKDVSINVHLYKDGGAGTGGTAVQAIETNILRPDVNSLYQASGDHGFMIPTPASLKDGNSHLIYVHGIDSTKDPAKSSLLFGVPKTIKCTNDNSLITTTTFTASKTSINSGEEVTLFWAAAGAVSVRINDQNNNPLPNVQGDIGSVRVSPASSTTYLFTASYPSGDVTKSLTVDVDDNGAAFWRGDFWKLS